VLDHLKNYHDSFPDDRHSGNLIRLERLLEHPSRFRLVLAEHNAPRYRDRIIERLADRFPHTDVWPVSPDLSAGDFIKRLGDFGPEQAAVQVVRLEDWPPEAGSRLFSGLNYRRENLAAAVPFLLVVWLPRETVTRFAREAPDLWAWRTAVLDFVAPPKRTDIHDRTLTFLGEDAERLRLRRQEIDDYFKTKPEPGYADGALLLEAAHIHERLGEWDRALRAAEKALAIYRDNDDQRSTAVTQGQIANILQARGELDQALRILNDEVLGAFERLGDVRSKAVIQGRIADILESRGELDQALALHERRLPVAQKLCDIELIAVTRFKIARIRLQQGNQGTDDMQRIHEELAASLASFRKLGRQDGIGHVGVLLARVLAMRGQPDEALAVLDQAVAAFDKLGDTQGVDQARRSRDRIRADR